jgi:hypothetical protein
MSLLEISFRDYSLYTKSAKKDTVCKKYFYKLLRLSFQCLYFWSKRFIIVIGDNDDKPHENTYDQKKVQMFRQIQESIYTYYHSKNVTPVIIVDEAQFLKNSILDDLRIIFNFEMDSKDYSVLILAGQSPFLTTS